MFFVGFFLDHLVASLSSLSALTDHYSKHVILEAQVESRPLQILIWHAQGTSLCCPFILAYLVGILASHIVHNCTVHTELSHRPTHLINFPSPPSPPFLLSSSVWPIPTSARLCSLRCWPGEGVDGHTSLWSTRCCQPLPVSGFVTCKKVNMIPPDWARSWPTGISRFWNNKDGIPSCFPTSAVFVVQWNLF